MPWLWKNWTHFKGLHEQEATNSTSHKFQTWTEAQQTTFDEAKCLLQSSVVLAHYDPSKKLVLACDASPYGVGAMLPQYQDDKTEKPVAFASRSLSKAEKNYSHLEKEGLAVIFGVKHLHQYLYGRHFTILTDHQPLR